MNDKRYDKRVFFPWIVGRDASILYSVSASFLLCDTVLFLLVCLFSLFASGSFEKQTLIRLILRSPPPLNLPVVREIAVIFVQNLGNLINECWKSCLLTSRLRVPKNPSKAGGGEKE